MVTSVKDFLNVAITKTILVLKTQLGLRFVKKDFKFSKYKVEMQVRYDNIRNSLVLNLKTYLLCRLEKHKTSDC